MPAETLLKEPAGVLHHALIFAGMAEVAEVTSVEVQAQGLIAGSALIAAMAEIDAGAVTLVLTGGTDGESYRVIVTATDTDSVTAQAEVEVAVIEAAWTMPDGSAPYVSIIDFVKRFGLPEVVAMTDADGTGRIDRSMLIAKLTDAQALADAHIAGRYAVPLAEVPLVVKKWVADLAAAALYPRGAPDGIAEQAKQAQRMLERVQAGQLPLPASAPPADAVSDNPVLIAPGYRAYPDGLRGY